MRYILFILISCVFFSCVTLGEHESEMRRMKRNYIVGLAAMEKRVENLKAREVYYRKKMREEGLLFEGIKKRLSVVKKEFFDLKKLLSRDTDGDGIVDLEDYCLVQPEDKNGVEDEDGCPEGDKKKKEEVVKKGNWSDKGVIYSGYLLRGMNLRRSRIKIRESNSNNDNLCGEGDLFCYASALFGRGYFYKVSKEALQERFGFMDRRRIELKRKEVLRRRNSFRVCMNLIKSRGLSSFSISSAYIGSRGNWSGSYYSGTFDASKKMIVENKKLYLALKSLNVIGCIRFSLGKVVSRIRYNKRKKRVKIYFKIREVNLVNVVDQRVMYKFSLSDIGLLYPNCSMKKRDSYSSACTLLSSDIDI